ncbi:MAG TPA: DUF5681 domain-containing protein [Stellaceae bacterium]|nr:DUF5681 domain-containing protein [Stellaceae bacterium]
MAVNRLLKQPARGPGRRFAKGQSGNPAGRPVGARAAATLVAEALLDGEAAALTRKVVERALDGDPTAMRLCFERLLAPRRERPVAIDLPPINSTADLAGAMGAIAAAAASGAITTAQAAELSQIVDTLVRAIAAGEFDRRLRQVEELLAPRP